MSKTENRICSWCDKPILPESGKRKRAPQATMHFDCAKEKERKESLRLMNAKRLPERKENVLQKADKYGISEDIVYKAKEKVIKEIGTKEEIIKGTQDKISEELEEIPEEDKYNTYLSPVWDIIPKRMKSIFGRKDFNEILDTKIERIVSKKIDEKFQEVKEEIKKFNSRRPFGF